MQYEIKTIKYASYKKKEQNKLELRLTEDIKNIKNNLTKGGDQENELKRLKEKNQELQHLYESQIKGFVIRSKASYIEGGEEITKYFASLEKRRSDTKTLHKLVINGTEYTSQREILEKKNKVILRIQIIDEEKTKKMNESISVKLNDKEKMSIEGIVTEYECACALKQMNNNKSPGSDGLTTEFFKIFWNDIKQFYVKSLNYSFETGNLTILQK